MAYLLEDALDTDQRQAHVVGLNDVLQQLVAKHLEHHANILKGVRVQEMPPQSVFHSNSHFQISFS